MYYFIYTYYNDVISMDIDNIKNYCYIINNKVFIIPGEFSRGRNLLFWF